MAGHAWSITRGQTRDASMSTNHAPFKRPPTLCDKREFSSFDAAMSAAEENRWWVEVYSNNGGPKCRTCGTQIKNNTLCITSDVIGTRPDPTRKTRKLYLAVNIFRFCLNNYCALNVEDEKVCPNERTIVLSCSRKVLC